MLDHTLVNFIKEFLISTYLENRTLIFTLALLGSIMIVRHLWSNYVEKVSVRYTQGLMVIDIAYVRQHFKVKGNSQKEGIEIRKILQAQIEENNVRTIKLVSSNRMENFTSCFVRGLLYKEILENNPDGMMLDLTNLSTSETDYLMSQYMVNTLNARNIPVVTIGPDV